MIDATQAAGILNVDSRRWKADAVVTSGYKWLGGHGGVALSAVSSSLLEQDPPLPGWFGTKSPFDFDATSLHYAADARRFTQSTMSYISMAGLVSLSHSEFHAEESIDALRCNGIACGVRNGRIRISLAPYNNSADIDALTDVLASINVRT